MHSVETWSDPLGLNMLDQSTKKMDVTYITKRCLTPLLTPLSPSKQTHRNLETKPFKAKTAPGFFDVELRMQFLEQKGDPLNRLNQVIVWKIFDPILAAALAGRAKGPGGRPPFEWQIMLKVLIIQRYYGLSDEQVEFQINDRLSFQRFWG